MITRIEIASVALTKVEHLGNKYIWEHEKEQEHVRTIAKALGKTAKQLNKHLANSSHMELQIKLEKVIFENTLTITLVLLANNDGENIELFKDQAEIFTNEIRMALKKSLDALNRAIQIGDSHPNSVSIVGGDSANINGVVTTLPLAANIANTIRSCAHDVNGLKLTLNIDDQNHELTYIDSSAVYADSENIEESHGFVKCVNDITWVAAIKPAGMKAVELAFDKTHRKTLINAQLNFEQIELRWVSKRRYRNGEPIIVGGQIIEAKKPLELKLECAT